MKNLALVLWLALGAAHAQTLQELATYQGADRQQRLLAGAKKEGALLFYTTFPSQYANQLAEPFVKPTAHGRSFLGGEPNPFQPRITQINTDTNEVRRASEGSSVFFFNPCSSV